LRTTQQKAALEARRSGRPLAGFFAAAECTNFESHASTRPRRRAGLGTQAWHSEELVKTPQNENVQNLGGGANGTRRISCSFQYTDIKSVEAKILERRARARVRSKCALLGVKKPVIEVERGLLNGLPHDGRRHYQGEAFATIRANSPLPADPSIKVT